jgi:hypothetical protein
VAAEDLGHPRLDEERRFGRVPDMFRNKVVAVTTGVSRNLGYGGGCG